MTEAEEIRSLLLAAGDRVTPRADDPLAALGRFRRHRTQRLLSVSIVAALVVATAVGIVVAGASPHHSSPPATSSTSTSTLVPPDSVEARLWVKSQVEADNYGDPAASVRWALGPLPLGRSIALTRSNGDRASSVPVYVIELRGTFVVGCCGPIGSGPHPTDVLTFWLYASNLSIEKVGTGAPRIDLRDVPGGFPLPEPPGGRVALVAVPGLTASYFSGYWSNSEGSLRQTTSSGLRWYVSYGRPGCTGIAGQPADCRWIRFRLTALVLAARAPLYRVTGLVTSDDVGLANGTGVMLAWAHDELTLTLSARPTIAVPEPWRG